MAKGIAINGQLRGKIGGTVYYRANGEQISRARNFKPNNPQTQSQMMQRLALANASKASKGLREIINHSFEGIRYGADSTRHFESKAQLTLRAVTPYRVGSSEYTPYVPLDALGFPVADYLISTGSLASANVSVTRDAETGIISDFKSNLALPEGVALNSITPAQFFELLGVSTDSQLTIIVCEAEESIGGAGSEIIFNDNILTHVIRLNFDQTKLDSPMLTGANINPAVLLTDKSQEYDVLSFASPDGFLHFTTDQTASAVALIVSRFVDGQWRRSTEKLVTAAPYGSNDPSISIEFWGWNWLDEVQKTLTKGNSIVEDRLLNKEPNDIG